MKYHIIFFNDINIYVTSCDIRLHIYAILKKHLKVNK